jgi:hypothetical protein
VKDLQRVVRRKPSLFHFLVGGSVFCAEWEKGSWLCQRRCHGGFFHRLLVSERSKRRLLESDSATLGLPGGLDDGSFSETAAAKLRPPNTVSAIFSAASQWGVEKTPRSKNDDFGSFLSASSIGGGQAADDFNERLLNSLMKGRTVRRIGPLGMDGFRIRR